MQHRKRIDKLGRPRDHRKALLKNLCTSLVTHERIQTTRNKAKALKAFFDRAVVTAKKKDTVNAYRYLAKYTYTRVAADKLIKDLKERYKDRPSGFTRITPIKYRVGDNAALVQIELV